MTTKTSTTCAERRLVERSAGVWTRSGSAPSSAARRWARPAASSGVERLQVLDQRGQIHPFSQQRQDAPPLIEGAFQLRQHLRVVRGRGGQQHQRRLRLRLRQLLPQALRIGCVSGMMNDLDHGSSCQTANVVDEMPARLRCKFATAGRQRAPAILRDVEELFVADARQART